MFENLNGLFIVLLTTFGAIYAAGLSLAKKSSPATVNALVKTSSTEEVIAPPPPPPMAPPPPPPCPTPPPPPCPTPPLRRRTTGEKPNNIRAAPKVKTLHWTKVANELIASRECVWKDIEGFRLNPKMLLKHFPSTKPPHSDKGKRARSVNPAQNRIVQLLDHKRSQQVAIMLGRLPPIAEIQARFQECDLNFLTPQTVQIMAEVIPTSEEIAMIEAYDGQKYLDRPERYFLMVSKVPCFALKIKAWHYILTFPEEISYLSSALNLTSQALCQLRESSELGILLNTVLVIGNCMNVGTTRSDARGFTLANLSLLRNIKSSDNSFRLLDYIAHVYLVDLGREKLNLRKEVNLVLTASEGMTVHELWLMAETMSNAFQVLSSLGSTLAPEDPFLPVLNNFNAYASEEIDGVIERADELQLLYRRALLYFCCEDHYNSDGSDSISFLKLFSTFLSDFEKSVGLPVLKLPKYSS